MSSKKTKQDERAEKLFDDIVYRGHKLAPAEKRKKPSQSNRKGGGLADAERENAMAEGYFRLLRLLLPGALVKLSALKDPRKTNMCDHTMPALIAYGLIMFIAHMPSRRAANREIGGNNAHEMIKQAIPELDTMPHADTLARLLERVDADGLEACYEKAVMDFVKSRTFLGLNQGRCLIAVDGTLKFWRKYDFDERALTSHRGDKDKECHKAYVLESVLILENGMVLPLFTEFLENEEGWLEDDAKKQDCEQKAFARMAGKIAKLIGKGRVTIVVDGLYASGPVVSRCKALGWDFMITLKRGSLKTVWEEYDGLREIETGNTLQDETDEGRSQTFKWSNDIEYTYGGNNKRIYLNVVTCKEEWVEGHPRSGNKPELKTCGFAWLSSFTVTAENAAGICNNIARRRWAIENHFHVEKNQGYGYGHCFSYDWNAMRAFHSLMKFAHFINAMILGSETAYEYVTAQGARWFIRKAWSILIYRGVGRQAAERLQAGQGGKRRGCIYRDIRLRAG
jgi:hypothetical protein